MKHVVKGCKVFQKLSSTILLILATKFIDLLLFLHSFIIVAYLCNCLLFISKTQRPFANHNENWANNQKWYRAIQLLGHQLESMLSGWWPKNNQFTFKLLYFYCDVILHISEHPV